MPPAANPNPDRASCASSVAPAAEAKDELVPEPLLPVRAPAAAPIVASAAPAAAAPVVCVSAQYDATLRTYRSNKHFDV